MRLIDADVLKEDLTRFYDGEVTARQLIDAQPTVQPDHVADIGKKVAVSCGLENDLIFRQAAIDAVEKSMYENPHENEIHRGMHDHEHRHFLTILMGLPSAQPATSCSEIPNGSDDTISRQAAIDLFPDDDLEYDTKGGYVAPHLARRMICELLPSAQPEQVCVANVTLTDEQVKEAVEKAKNAVISVIEPEPHWIPCSERMPEDGRYLCDYGDCIDFGRVTNGKWYVDGAIAWMPLPEPYQGGGE